MLNLHLQAVEQELVKIIPLVVDSQVVLGRRPAAECSKQNGFFAKEDYPSISREHAILKTDANKRVGGCSTAPWHDQDILTIFLAVYSRRPIKAGNIHQWKTCFIQE